MTELSRIQKDAIMKAIGLDGLDQESKDVLLGLLNDNKTENIILNNIKIPPIVGVPAFFII